MGAAGSPDARVKREGPDVMDTTFEHKVRERAYAIWMASGMSEGEAERHWLHAERIVRNEAEMPSAGSETTEFRAAAAPAKTASSAGSTKPTKAQSAKAGVANTKTKAASTRSAAPKPAAGKVGKAKVDATKVAAVETTAPRRMKSAAAEAIA